MVGSSWPCWANEIAASRCAWAWLTSVFDVAAWNSCFCAVDAAMRNSAWLLFCSAIASCMAWSLSVPKSPWVVTSLFSADFRIAPCSEASSFMRETRPSTRTESDSVESLLPVAISSLRASTWLIVLAYSLMTTSAGSLVVVAAARSEARLLIAVITSWASCWTSGG